MPKKSQYWSNEAEKTASYEKENPRIDTFFKKTSLPPSSLQSPLQKSPTLIPVAPVLLVNEEGKKEVVPTKKRRPQKKPSLGVTISLHLNNKRKLDQVEEEQHSASSKKKANTDLARDEVFVPDEEFGLFEGNAVQPNNTNSPTYTEEENEVQSDLENSQNQLNVMTPPSSPYKRLRRNRIFMFDSVNDVQLSQKNNPERSAWIKRVIKKLEKKSDMTQAQDPAHPFKSLAKQWVATDNADHRGAKDDDCELCGHNDITDQFEIRNVHNNKILIVGSRCIEHFAQEGLRYQDNSLNTPLTGFEAIEAIQTMVSDAQEERQQHRKAVASLIRST